MAGPKHSPGAVPPKRQPGAQPQHRFIDTGAKTSSARQAAEKAVKDPLPKPVKEPAPDRPCRS
jgi:hypothetical protein